MHSKIWKSMNNIRWSPPWRVWLILSLLLIKSESFVPNSVAFLRRGADVVNNIKRRRAPPSFGLGLAANDDHDDDDNDDDERHHHDHNNNNNDASLAVKNSVRTDVRIFLTQRAIQSFIYLLTSCRDPHTVGWLESKYQFRNLEHFHGTGAFNLTRYNTWDSILVDLLQRPSDVVVVEAKRRGSGYRGWSKNNPYVREQNTAFKIEINPLSLVSRIVSVREQIAKEWMDDLDTLILANDMILTSYHDNHVSARDAEEECVDFEDDDQDDECVKTEDLIAPYSDRGRRPKRVYERNAMTMLSNKIDREDTLSSPYRRGNFDLVFLLATQESVHRVLREYHAEGEEREVSFRWLCDFYADRVAEYFDGNQAHGRADDFLEELLLTPPSTKNANGVLEMIDPLRIAEDVIRTRSQVASEWKKVISAVPRDHIKLRKVMLARQMGTSGVEESAPPSPLAAEVESSSSSTDLSDAGEFQ